MFLVVKLEELLCTITALAGRRTGSCLIYDSFTYHKWKEDVYSGRNKALVIANANDINIIFRSVGEMGGTTNF